MRIRSLVLFVSLITVSLAFAQDETPTRVTPQNLTGELPYAPTIGTSIETVDLATGALNVKVPIVAVPGRGMNSELFFRFNSNYFVVAERVDGLGNGYYAWRTEQDSMWQKNFTKISNVFSTRKCDDFGHTSQSANFWSNFIFTDPSGAKHPLAIRTTTGYCGGAADTEGPALSGQGIRGYGPSSSPANSSVKLSDGTMIKNSSWTDPNGNQRSDWTDTLGRSLYSVSTTTDPVTLQPVQDVYTVKDANGANQTYTVNWQWIEINTSFAISPIRELNQSTFQGGSHKNVVSSIVLPNGTSYQFTYDAGGYGEITRIDLPTGGYVTYQYANFSVPNDYHRDRRYVSSRTVTVGGQSSTWTINLQYVNFKYVSTVTFPATAPFPGGTQSVFTSDPATGSVENVKVYPGAVQGIPVREFQMQYGYDSGDPFSDPCYDASIFPAPAAQITGPRLERITTILENGLQSKKEYTYDSFTYTFHPGKVGGV